ncbi:MAG: hypothetical protein WD851_02165 [Pirellulales bacterium]
MADSKDNRPRYTLAIPNLPKPAMKDQFIAAKQSASVIFGDIPQGNAIDAYTAVSLVKTSGHTLRCSVWAIWELVECGGLIVHPRSNIDVVSEELGSTTSYIDDPRPRFDDGRLIPDGPVKIAEGEPANWRLVRLEPNHAILDKVIEEIRGLPLLIAATVGNSKQLSSNSKRSSTKIEVVGVSAVERTIPALDASHDDWLTPAQVKELDSVEVDSLRTLRNAGEKNADGTFGIDKSGRKWRKPSGQSVKVFYWRPSLLSS